MKAYYISLLLFFTIGLVNPVEASPLIDLIKKRKTGSVDVVEKYSFKAMNAGSKKNLSIMRAYIDSAEMACKDENIEIPAILHLARAEYFFFSNDYKHAQQEAAIAMKLAENERDHGLITRISLFLGLYYNKTGLYDEAIKYYEDAATIARKEKLKGLSASAYSGLSEIYKSLGKIDEFRQTLTDLIRVATDEKDSLTLGRAYLKIGTSYTDMKPDPAKADSLLRKAYEISTIKKDTSVIANALANTGWNLYLQKKYNEAIKYYNKSLTYSMPAMRYALASNGYGNLGTIARDMGKPDLAISYYTRAIDLAKKVNDVYSLSWIYNDMSQMYLAMKDTSNAYKSFVLFKKYSDEGTSSMNLEGLANAKMRYEAESQNKEVELLSLRIKNQRILYFGAIGLLVLSVAVLILLQSRSRINTQRKISEMNQKISEVTQANLRQQMNPHFIFNTLNSIQYYMYQNDKLATNNYLTKFSSLMRKVLENSQHTSVPLRDELDALTLYLELEKIRFKDKFDYEINVEDDIDPILYKVPTMLIQPYVENSICHGLMPSEARGMIKISLKLRNDYISCIIEDNGIGREAANLKKINNKQHNSFGTRIVSSRLDLVNALYGTNLKTEYTDLKNDDGEPEGTKVEIHIPILT
jgi:tetratricopeptide (TPR) repeat protein/cell division protein FtsL